MKRIFLCTLIAGFLSIDPVKVTAEPSSALAVIVNKTTALLSLTSKDLQGIYLGQKEHWPNGQKILPVSLGVDEADTKVFLKEICSMSPGDYKKYFMMLKFQGKTANPPHLLPSSAAIRTFVSSTPGAIGIISAGDVDASVNVIPLDGSSPGAPGYKLALSK